MGSIFRDRDGKMELQEVLYSIEHGEMDFEEFERRLTLGKKGNVPIDSFRTDLSFRQMMENRRKSLEPLCIKVCENVSCYPDKKEPPLFMATEFKADHKEFDHNVKRLNDMFNTQKMLNSLKSYRTHSQRMNNQYLKERRNLTAAEKHVEDNKVQLDRLRYERRKKSKIARAVKRVETDADPFIMSTKLSEKPSYTQLNVASSQSNLEDSYGDNLPLWTQPSKSFLKNLNSGGKSEESWETRRNTTSHSRPGSMLLINNYNKESVGSLNSALNEVPEFRSRTSVGVRRRKITRFESQSAFDGRTSMGRLLIG